MYELNKGKGMSKVLTWAWSKFASITTVFLLIYLAISSYGLLGLIPEPRGAYEFSEILKTWGMLLGITAISFSAGRE